MAGAYNSVSELQALWGDNGSIMQTTPAILLFGAISSAMFIDPSVQPHVARLGKISVAVFGALFVIAEAWSLLA